MTTPATCADCGGAMERGYVLDHADGNDRVRARWIQGKPERGVLGGLLFGLRTAGLRQIAIRAFRCTGCGLLKQYALDEDEL